MNAEKLKLLAPDLTKSYPRSPRETLAGCDVDCCGAAAMASCV